MKKEKKPGKPSKRLRTWERSVCAHGSEDQKGKVRKLLGVSVAFLWLYIARRRLPVVVWENTAKLQKFPKKHWRCASLLKLLPGRPERKLLHWISLQQGVRIVFGLLRLRTVKNDHATQKKTALVSGFLLISRLNLSQDSSNEEGNNQRNSICEVVDSK